MFYCVLNLIVILEENARLYKLCQQFYDHFIYYVQQHM